MDKSGDCGQRTYRCRGGAARDESPERAIAVRDSCSKETVTLWRKRGKAVVYLDLDNADTFPQALQGLDRILLMGKFTPIGHAGRTSPWETPTEVAELFAAEH